MGGREALAKLMRGNGRFAANRGRHIGQDAATCCSLITGQTPHAVVVGCADSRVPPELLFDQGIGDLFVIRVAGNVLDDAVTGSIEYAVQELRVPLVVVLGHQNCGAVGAAVTHQHPGGHLDSIVNPIEQVALQLEEQHLEPSRENVIRAHANAVVAELAVMDPIIDRAVDDGRLLVAAAYFSLETGRVEILSSTVPDGAVPHGSNV